MKLNLKSPAAELAKKKPRQRPARNKSVYQRKTVWAPNLRDLREAHGLSMHAVAAAVKLGVSSYWQIEHGSDPMLVNAVRIAEFFGVRVEDIWNHKAG